MKSTKRGFTLVELLLVMVIIGILLATLLPAIGASRKAVRRNDTVRRITLVGAYVDHYYRVFNDYPLSRPVVGYEGLKSDCFGDGKYTFNPSDLGSYSDRHQGGALLFYYLVGPDKNGWNRVKHKVSYDWEVPAGLVAMRTKDIIGDKDKMVQFFAVEDGYGFMPKYAGTIQYSRAVNRSRKNQERFEKWDIYQSYYEGTVIYKVPTDGADAHVLKMFSQCDKPYVLVSPGADHYFGWYYYDSTAKRWQPNASTGMTDDIANFPLK